MGIDKLQRGIQLKHHKILFNHNLWWGLNQTLTLASCVTNSAQTYESLVLYVGCFFDNDKLGLLMIINIFHGTINRPALLYVFRVYCFLAGILLDINCYYSHKGNNGHCWTSTFSFWYENDQTEEYGVHFEFKVI